MNDEPNSLSIIAHKIRTPLTVIISTVNNLLEGAFGGLDPEQHKWIKKLETHASHLERLVNQILEMLKDQPEKAKNILTGLEQADAFPAAFNRTSEGTSSVPQATSPASHVPTILIVDDEPDIVDVMQEGLNTKGFKTVAASNGTEGTSLALTLKPDLILMDVLLQRENGIELCRTIKSQLNAFTPVILVTGQDDLREKISGSNYDADDILTKPFQMEELFARVSSMVRLKKLYDRLKEIDGIK